MSLRVGLDATSAARQTAGIGRYTRELLGGLVRRHDDIRYRVFYCTGGHLSGRLPPLDSRFTVRRLPLSDRVMNAVWHRARLPFPVQLITGAVDLFHSPDFTLPPTAGRPRIVTVHDLAFLTVPECAYPTLRAYLTRVVPHSAERADRVIAVSENTRQDVIRFFHIDPEKVTTILEGVDPAFSPGDRAIARIAVQHLGIHDPYILSVGTLEPRKNYERLLTAYGRLRDRGCSHKLVVAGARGWLYKPIFRHLEDLELEQHVIFLTPPDDMLPALYRAADAFVYPSLYEGFGLPALEALACGTPCACSATSSLPEVVGEAAVTFDPLESDQISLAIERLLEDAHLRDRLRIAGPAQAAAFSWDTAAAQTVDMYRTVMNG